MTKAELIEEVSKVVEMTRKDSEEIVETIFDSIVGSLHKGEKIEIRGFGSFRTRQRQPRVGRNPKTGTRVEVPSKRIPYFKPSKELRDLVNQRSEAVSAATAGTPRLCRTGFCDSGRFHSPGTLGSRVQEHLWTPWRSKYIQGERQANGCVFCNAATGSNDAESLVVHRAEYSFVILNRYPYTSGHVMIAPYQHVSRLGQVEPVVTAEMMSLARNTEAILEQVYRPNGLNLGMNLGEAAGAGIEQHIHMHVLPRWTGDANFMTTIGHTRILPELLEDTYAKLAAAFSSPQS